MRVRPRMSTSYINACAFPYEYVYTSVTSFVCMHVCMYAAGVDRESVASIASIMESKTQCKCAIQCVCGKVDWQLLGRRRKRAAPKVKHRSKSNGKSGSIRSSSSPKKRESLWNLCWILLRRKIQTTNALSIEMDMQQLPMAMSAPCST